MQGGRVPPQTPPTALGGPLESVGGGGEPCRAGGEHAMGAVGGGGGGGGGPRVVGLHHVYTRLVKKQPA